MNHFTNGFADEIVKEARLRAAVGKLVGRGKDYMRRRRLAKELGVKPADVDRVLAMKARQARNKKLLTGALASGALTAGSLAGAKALD